MTRSDFLFDWKAHTKSFIKNNQIKISKSKGQNFLIKKHVINQMMGLTELTESDHVLEIGGGLGILTESLANSPAKITVIEKETKFAEYLQQTYPKINVINEDALKMEWPDVNKVIANLPYSISSPILEKIVHSNIDEGILMLQKEVAQRCISAPGSSDYSRISILMSLHMSSKIRIKVTPESFFPRPKVQSSIIHIHRTTPSLVNDHFQIEEFTKNLFTLRRRTLRSVVRGFLKRKTQDTSVWEEIPFKDSRIYSLSIHKLDQVLTHLINKGAWPFTNDSK